MNWSCAALTRVAEGESEGQLADAQSVRAGKKGVIGGSKGRSRLQTIQRPLWLYLLIFIQDKAYIFKLHDGEALLSIQSEESFPMFVLKDLS